MTPKYRRLLWRYHNAKTPLARDLARHAIWAYLLGYG